MARGESPKIRTNANGTRSHYGRVDLAPDPLTGKRRQASVTAPVSRHATKYWAAVRARIEAEARAVPAAAETPLADYLLLDWLPTKEASGKIGPGTAHDYEGAIRRWVVPELGRVPLAALTAPRIDRWQTGLLRRGLSPATVRATAAILDAALGRAVRLGLIPRNPGDGVDRPALPEPPPPPWTPEQAAIFLAGTADDPDAALWAVLLLGGLRIGEALALRWEDVAVDGAEVRVPRTITKDRRGRLVLGDDPKTAAGRRTVSLPPPAAERLTAHRAQRVSSRHPSPLVFAGSRGGRRWPHDVTSRLRALAEGLDLPPLTPHGLRHTQGMLLTIAEVPLRVVMTRLGHRSPAVAMRYAHPGRDQQRDAAARAAAILAPPRDDDVNTAE